MERASESPGSSSVWLLIVRDTVIMANIIPIIAICVPIYGTNANNMSISGYNDIPISLARTIGIILTSSILNTITTITAIQNAQAISSIIVEMITPKILVPSIPIAANKDARTVISIA